MSIPRYWSQSRRRGRRCFPAWDFDEVMRKLWAPAWQPHRSSRCGPLLAASEEPRATTRLVISKYCNGGDVGSIGHIAGENGHKRLEHRHIGGALLFGFGCCLGYCATAYCRRCGRGIEMIERLHVEHHFV